MQTVTKQHSHCVRITRHIGNHWYTIVAPFSRGPKADAFAAFVDAITEDQLKSWSWRRDHMVFKSVDCWRRGLDSWIPLCGQNCCGLDTWPLPLGPVQQSA